MHEGKQRHRATTRTGNKGKQRLRKFHFLFRWRYKRWHAHVTPNKSNTSISTGALKLDRLGQQDDRRTDGHIARNNSDTAITTGALERDRLSQQYGKAGRECQAMTGAGMICDQSRQSSENKGASRTPNDEKGQNR